MRHRLLLVLGGAGLILLAFYFITSGQRAESPLSRPREEVVIVPEAPREPPSLPPEPADMPQPESIGQADASSNTIPSHGSSLRDEKRLEIIRLRAELEEAKSKVKDLQDDVGSFRSADKAIATLQEATVVLNVPETINVSEEGRVVLRLSLDEDAKELLRSVPNVGYTRVEAALASPYMTASLTTSAFDIQRLTPERQMVGSYGRTSWEWEITPKTPGVHSVDVTLTADLEVDGRERSRVLRTYSRRVLIDVTTWQSTRAFIAENWKWAWSTLLIPIIPMAWKKYKSSRKSSVNKTVYVPRTPRKR